LRRIGGRVGFRFLHGGYRYRLPIERTIDGGAVMWKCPNCGEEIDEAFEECWNCGAGQDGTIDPDFHRESPDPEVPDSGAGSETLAALPDDRVPESPDRHHRPVTVTVFNSGPEAEICRIVLEQNGIRSWIVDENMATALVPGMVGGVKLQVDETDLTQAREVLDRDA
jgi:hypothetical protein